MTFATGLRIYQALCVIRRSLFVVRPRRRRQSAQSVKRRVIGKESRIGTGADLSSYALESQIANRMKGRQEEDQEKGDDPEEQGEKVPLGYGAVLAKGDSGAEDGQ